MPGVTPARLGLAYRLHDVKLLTDLVGPGHAKRLLYTGALIGAEEAQRIGLVESVEENSVAILEAILASSPHSQSAAKAIAGADFAVGARAFLQKRNPAFGPRPNGDRASPTPSE